MYPETHTHVARTKVTSIGVLEKYGINIQVPVDTLCRKLESGKWVTFDSEILTEMPTKFTDVIAIGVVVNESDLTDIKEVLQI